MWMGRWRWDSGKGGGWTAGGVAIEVELIVGRERPRRVGTDDSVEEDVFPRGSGRLEVYERRACN
jgi:hypothetical protein